MRRTSRLLTGGTLTAAVLCLPATASAAPAEVVFRTVEHRVTLEPMFYASDICGDRAVTETVTRTVQVEQLIERANGFHYNYVAVFTYTADFVDPDIPDTTWRGNEVIHAELTAGGTFTFSESLRARDSEIVIHYDHHVTAQGDGTVRVDREVNRVTGCP